MLFNILRKLKPDAFGPIGRTPVDQSVTRVQLGAAPSVPVAQRMSGPAAMNEGIWRRSDESVERVSARASLQQFADVLEHIKRDVKIERMGR